MQINRRNIFTTIRTEGAILPADLLKKISDNDKSIDGLTPGAYHLDPGEKLNEAISSAWNRLLGAWSNFKSAREKLSTNDAGTTITRERWLLPLFNHLSYGRLQLSKGIIVNGESFPVSHAWQKTPIHLIGCNIGLDKRTPGQAGAARMSPHGMVQQLLNRSDDHLWAFLSNGLTLRILRDNITLTRQAYVEFDLESMMDNEVYSDFILLFLLCHQSRVEAERPEECWLERWSKIAQDQGIRALNQLRSGVEEAITALGKGFLTHPQNSLFKEKLKSGALSNNDYYRELLRLIYRLIFLFVAEDRELLFTSDTSPKVKDLYTRYYSTGRLRRLATRRKGTQHSDQWQGLKLVFQKLGADEGCPALGLPALGSFLWSNDSTPNLDSCELANADLLASIRALTVTSDSKTRRPVDYKNLGSEELGSIYESLLELHPRINSESGAFELGTAGGHERKTTGSYYTPSSLVQCLLDTALDPVLDEAAKKDDPGKAILDLKVCDPACGSGHFLIAASHRMAKRLAAIRTGDDEPSPEATRTALRDIIGHCVFGVDINPLAVELCKVSLWMEALEPGKPLSFLEHKIQCGNSLLGTTPALLQKGIPDDAFKPIEGDDKSICREYKKQNKQERESLQSSLFAPDAMPWQRQGDLATGFMNLDDIPDDTIESIHKKEERYAKIRESSGYLYGEFWADTWCAAFVWKKTKDFPYPITEEVFRKIEKSPHDVPKWMKEEIIRLKKQYNFFHWHIAFPIVFKMAQNGQAIENEQTGWNGGFDVVLGNPPWERIKLQEKEWFANRRLDIANAPKAATRGKMIEVLKTEDPKLYGEFIEDRRKSEGESHLLRDSDRYPLCGTGDVNTYAVFAELKRLLIRRESRVGCLVPSGIATDDTTRFFFQNLMESNSLISLYDFTNALGSFPAVDRNTKFCLLTLTGSHSNTNKAADFVFFAEKTTDLLDHNRHFNLTISDIRLLNPNSQTCPVFRTKSDAELSKILYKKLSPIYNEISGINPWGINFLRMFDMANDSGSFITREVLEEGGWKADGNRYGNAESRMLPLYEAKMIHHFDHRFADVGPPKAGAFTRGSSEYLSAHDHDNSLRYAFPRFWVNETEVITRLYPKGWQHKWFISFRDVTGNVANIRTSVFSVIPWSAVGHTLPVCLSEIQSDLLILFLSNVISLVFDYCTRQKMGGTHLTYFILKQLPILTISNYENHEYLTRELEPKLYIGVRSLELSYTSWDLEPFAKDCGYDGPPFRWDDERRFKIRCELDAAYFHLYLGTPEEWQKQGTPELLGYFTTPREAVEYVMETFPIVKRKDEAKYGSYRTKELILDIYDAMAEAIRTGKPYQTILDPPPGPPTNPDGTFAPLPDWPAGTPKPQNWPPHIHEPRR